MADPVRRPDDEFYEVVDREAADAAERSASKILYQALKQRKDELGAGSQIPAEDRQLSEQILASAHQRSSQISGSRRPSSVRHPAPAGRGIPGWLVVAWVLAIIGAAVAAYYFW